MHVLAEQLLKGSRKQESLRAGDRVTAAVSGGADSVALLFLLLELRSELGIVLSVAHVNHKLRGEESEEDARFVRQLAQQHELELHFIEAPVDAEHPSGVEGAARALRYGFFRQLTASGQVAKIATAHTLDDQAETVLLRIFRGTGVRGLAAIHPRLAIEEQGRSCGEVIRPLLRFRHDALQEYLRERGQTWREDSSNRDTTFLRNRVRHQLLPLILNDFGDSAIEHMADLAEIARAEEEHWVSGHPEVFPKQPSTSLAIDSLLALPLATQRRLVRGWLASNAPDLSISFRLIEEALELAGSEAGRKMELAEGHGLRRTQSKLVFEPSASSGKGAPADYEYSLTVPGTVNIPELGSHVEASVVNPSVVPEDQRGQLLYLGRTPKEIRIRNWRAGDRFWPAHTATEKKVKELLSDRHATGVERKLWPVALVEGCGLVWVRGFPVPAAFRAPASTPKAIWIREIAGLM